MLFCLKGTFHKRHFLSLSHCTVFKFPLSIPLCTISTAILEHDIPAPLVNLYLTPLSFISQGKYTFSFKGAKNVPIKGVDDKRQIIATFAVSLTGTFLQIQLIFRVKTKRTLPCMLYMYVCMYTLKAKVTIR